MNMKGRTRLVTIGLAGVLAVGLLGASVALAQDTGDSNSPSNHVDRHGPKGHKVLKGTLKSIYENSGLPAGTLKQGLKDGKSINQVLTENSVHPATVEAAVLVDFDASLDELVASGEIDDAKAADLYLRAEERLPQLMDRIPGPDREGRKPGERLMQGIKGLLGSAAETLGMEPRELGMRLKDGETVADVAAAEGVPVKDVVDAMVTDANARVDAAVAEGTIDEAKGTELKSKLAERIERFVTEGGQRRR